MMIVGDKRLREEEKKGGSMIHPAVLQGNEQRHDVHAIRKLKKSNTLLFLDQQSSTFVKPTKFVTGTLETSVISHTSRLLTS